MSEMTLESFPLVRGALRSTRRFDKALEVILDGVANESIRNVDWKDAKDALGRAVDEAYEARVKVSFRGRGQEMDPEVYQLYWACLIMSLHDCISAAKKVAKTKATGPEVDAMRARFSEVLPLALVVASLKTKVVKGRAPNTGTAESLGPPRVDKTCPCCLRGICVVRGTMAHHGYQRPGHGFQTASCAGIQFEPLEVSPKGLEYVVRTLRERLERDKKALDEQTTEPKYLMGKRERKGPLERIERGDPLWPRLFEAFIAELEFSVRMIRADLPPLEEMLATWHPGMGGR